MYTEHNVQSIILEKRHTGRSLRRIALDYPGLNFGDIQRAAKGIFPHKTAKRRAFGLPDFSRVLAIHSEIPNGSQALIALYCTKCGHPFIPNHPRRRKCFLCSPYRKTKGVKDYV